MSETDRTCTSTPRDNLKETSSLVTLTTFYTPFTVSQSLCEMADTIRNGPGCAPKPDDTPEVKKNKKESRGVAGAVKTWMGKLCKHIVDDIANGDFRHACCLRLKIFLIVSSYTLS
jgi:hypothetical protein